MNVPSWMPDEIRNHCDTVANGPLSGWTEPPKKVKDEFQTIVRIPSGTGILENVDEEKQFVIRMPLGIVEVPLDSVQIVLTSWLKDCPRKYGACHFEF